MGKGERESDRYLCLSFPEGVPVNHEWQESQTNAKPLLRGVGRQANRCARLLFGLTLVRRISSLTSSTCWPRPDSRWSLGNSREEMKPLTLCVTCR